MKSILVDFWTDTLDNLDELSKSEAIPRNELIRRGAESVLILQGLSKTEIGAILLGELEETERILSEKPLNKANLVQTLSKAVAISSALSAIYVVNDGKEEASIIRIYFRTLQEHLQVISDSDYVIQKEDSEAIKQDVMAFSNILAKLEKSRIVSSEPKQIQERGRKKHILKHIGRLYSAYADRDNPH